MAVTTVEKNERIARERFDRVWNQGEFDSDHLADDYRVVTHKGEHEEFTPEEYHGLVAHFRDAFPDLHKEPDHVVADEHKVVIQYTFRGTHEGELQGIPPTYNEVEIAAVDILTIEDGKITREWFVADFLRLMKQLDVVE